MRKTKIVCTLGPATDDKKVLEGIARAGMDVARINCSHGTHEENQVRIDALKKMRAAIGKPIALMLDTRGPEIRIKTFKNGKIAVKEGQKFVFRTTDCEGDENGVGVTYENLPEDVHRGDRLLVDDGLVEFSIDNLDKTSVECTALNSGELSNRKSINIPGVSISMPYVSENDRADILFGIKNDIDFVAASFARTAYDIVELRKLLDENGGENIKIIAKIENREGVDNVDDILKISDGIMVARGDMGVEIPFEEIPAIQKMLIKRCYREGKVVITATQMLDSMIRNPRPTRAETTDVANAIYDGTSAIMLSGETSIGKYPVLVVETMAKIAVQTENNIDYKKRFETNPMRMSANVANAVSHATCTTAHDLGAVAVLPITKSGTTARMISKFRPQCPIVAVTISEKAYRQLNLSWGVTPLLGEEKFSTEELFDHAVDLSVEAGLVKNGDIVVIAAGIPVGISGNTNILKVHLVGHVLIHGKKVNSLSVSGNLCVAHDENDALRDFKPGDILVIKKTTNMMMDILKHARGIIVEEDGLSSHAAIVGMALNIPVVVGAQGATELLKSGTTVTIDSSRGLVYSGVVKVFNS